MKVLFYDNGTTGHHVGYLTGIVAEAEKKGVDFMIASAAPPSTLDDRARWIEAPPAPLRNLRANRAALARATEMASSSGANTLVDLYLDKQIWNVHAIKGIDRCAHVLHHAKQYSYVNRTGPARARTMFLRRRLKRWTSMGAIVIVHTHRAFEIMQDFLPSDQIVRAGYPVSKRIRQRQKMVDTTRPTLLFVGAGREEKGLDNLFEALAFDPGIARLLILGRQPPGTRSRLSQKYPEVAAEWHDSFVEDSFLTDAYATSDLAVLPYRISFGQHGGPSSVILESLSSGIPIVTTPALEDQLPGDFSGAVVASSDTPTSLFDALRFSLDKLPHLFEAADREGPAYISANHTYERYLDTLLSAASAAIRN